MRPRPARFASLLCVVAGVAGCGADAPAPGAGWAGEVLELPGGGAHVASPRAGVWDARAAWRIEETARIGALEGDGPDVFGRISALGVDPDGRIHVFDATARELRVFAPDGRFLRSFGRRGGGPGEFESVIGIDFAPDGSGWLVDPQNVRYTVLRGEEFRSHPRASAVYHLPWTGGFAADGSFHDAVVLPGGDEVLLRVGPDGAVRDTFPIAKPDLPVPGTRSMSFPLPYAPRVLRVFDRRGFVWTAVTHEYRFVRTTLDGDTAGIVSRAYEAPALTVEEQDSVRRYARRLEAEFGVAVRADMMPRAAPILRWFAVDDRGGLWACRADADRCDALDVFDADGRFLGEVELPFGPLQAPPVIRDDRLWGVAEGELGVPVMVAGRIVRP